MLLILPLSTFWRYNPATLVQEVIALRDIEAGEEISHSCKPRSPLCHTQFLTLAQDTSLGLTHGLRRQALAAWGFNCTCELCSAAPEHVYQSDLRRHRLAEIHEEMSGQTLDEKYVDDRVEELTYLIEKEEMWPLFTEYYMVAARSYLNVDRPERARRYAKIADETWHAYGGANHDGVEEMRELWKRINEELPEPKEKGRKRRK